MWTIATIAPNCTATMGDLSSLRLFALSVEPDFGETVARHAGVVVAEHEERIFEDGEHKIRPATTVRGGDAYILASLFGDGQHSVNDKLMRLVFFAAALKDAGAARVTVVAPYLCYSRKDRRTKSRDPVTTRYVAQILEAVGVDRVVGIDVHNRAAFENAFRVSTEHLEARVLFAEHFQESCAGETLVVVSPDAGGVKRAEDFRRTLVKLSGKTIELAFMEKHRKEGVVSGRALVGDVSAKTAIIVDDLVSTGTTLARAAEACVAAGARRVFAAITHAVFSPGADEALGPSALEKLVVTNTVPPGRLKTAAAKNKLVVVDAAPLVAAAIVALHDNGSISALLDD